MHRPPGDRRLRRLLFAGTALLLVAVWLRGCVFRPQTDHPGSSFNTGHNAAWLGVEWSMAPHTDGEVAALGRLLSEHQIRYAYVYTTYLKADGEFNRTYDHAPQFVEQMHRLAPGITVLAWIGLPIASSAPGWSGNTVDLVRPETRAQIAALCRRMTVEIGFDGVHLNAEPLSPGDEAFFELLHGVRAAIGSGAVLSIAAPDYQLLPIPWNTWRAGDFALAARAVDQIAVMSYDSGLPLPALYRLWLRWQVIRITEAVSGGGSELLFGIPASEEGTLTHRPWAENVRSGLQGLVDGLNDRAGRPGAVDGVALYPLWEMDEDEWLAFDRLWLGR